MNTNQDDMTPPTPPAHSPHRTRYGGWRLGMWVVFLALLGGAVVGSILHGWELRRQAWVYFEPARFRGDIWRNFYFGTLALRDGMLNLYDDQAAHPPHTQLRLNYTPMRTVVFAAWAKSTGEPERTPAGQNPEWEQDLAFNQVLNDFNIGIALLGAIAAGLLVQHWIRRHNRLAYRAAGRAPPRSWWAWAAAAIAFWLYWYNPAGLILGHGWPSPNAWLIPFFLWALLFASWEMWCVAGVTVGIGAMFQGQHLLVAPFWVLWPIFAGQPMRMLRWTIGFLFGFLALAAGWLLTIRPDLALPDRQINWAAIAWIAGGVVAVMIVLAARRWTRRPSEPIPAASDQGDPLSFDDLITDDSPPPDFPDDPIGASDARSGRVHSGMLLAGAVIVAAVGLLIWPVIGHSGLLSPLTAGLALMAIGLIGLIWWRGWRLGRYAIPGVIAVQLLLCIPLYGASTSWWDVGFLYGTERHLDMAVGTASNLGSLLRDRYGWETPDQIVTTLPGGSIPGLVDAPREVTIKELMLAIYIVTLILASVATAIQWRRGNRNFLLAATVPWLLMAVIPAQMHERYLGFAALAGVVWIGAGGGIGWALMGVFLSVVTYVQVVAQLMYSNWRTIRRGDDPFVAREYFGWVTNNDLLQLFRGVEPIRGARWDIAWALLAAAAAMLIASFVLATPSARLPKVLTGAELEAED